MFPLMDPDVAWPERQRAIRAMYLVFERIFDPKCSPHLSHTLTESDPERNPLNGECYMWWDVCPLQGHPGPTAAQVESIVDAYIQRHLLTWPADEQGQSLRGYAFAARRGLVQ